jgi:alanyl aminopeptidase
VPVNAPPIAVAPEAAPLGRLPADTRPTKYSLALRVDPAQPRFEGVVDVDVELERLRDVIWMHGKDLAVKRATVQPEGFAPIEARWESAGAGGVAALRLASSIGPGRARVHLEYDAPFGAVEQGLYVVARGSERYAFSQLEPLYARRVFPSFDEPGHKTPFAISVTVPRGLTAVANTREVSRAPVDGAWDRVSFAPTERMPTYLFALAVGPLDIVTVPDLPPTAVRKRPLPLRGVATKGRGKEMAFTLAKTGSIVNMLESYFGSEYPYDKLDMIAVPDKGGAMENPGAITFGESLLLFEGEGAPVDQLFNFYAVAGHEIAHQWFGDLVTMKWWDDLWLNEAFAAWMEPHVVKVLAPELRPEIRAMESVHFAMGADSLVSSRKIRQEIADDNDIEGAFDAITYDKGSAVLAMFERWIGAETFQKGVRAHLAAHRFGTAGADDLLAALSTAAGRDVATPLRTFLDQPGLPYVEASVACDGKPRLLLKQSRFLPLGSPGKGDTSSWQIPVCARYPEGKDGKQIKESCTLLDKREGALALDTATCPAWVMPNADAAGYYRWSLVPADGKKLATAGYKSLNERERASLGRSLVSAFGLGKASTTEVMEAIAPLAADPSHVVSATPISMLEDVLRWFSGEPLEENIRAYARSLYQPAYRALGWDPKKGAREEPSRILQRQMVLDFLARDARDEEVRREAKKRGLAYLGFGKDNTVHPEAVSPNLAGTALAVAAEDGGASLFDAIVAMLAKEEREVYRGRLLRALGAFRAPELAARARALELTESVHANELSAILGTQLHAPETRAAAWAWFEQNVDKIIARMPAPWAAYVMYSGGDFCDRAHRDAVEKLFTPRLPSLEGGPRVLAGVLEGISLCVARREAQEAGARAFFAKKRR